MKVPLFNLAAQNQPLAGVVRRAVDQALASGALVGGEEVAGFEGAFAAYLGVDHAAGVGNGTDALTLALKAMGLEPGDEVIVPAMTFIATAEAVTLAGGRPVFADVDPATRCLDAAAAAAAVTRRTRALVPVHLYGHPADMDGLCRLADRHGLWVVEDAAQAHGAEWGGKKAGAWGDAGCFSFYPTKNLGALGDAGAVAADDAELIGRVRLLANHGRGGPYGHSHLVEGGNSRLDALQAAVLAAKLERLDQWNQARRSLARAWRERLAGLDLVLPADHPGHVYHLFVVESAERDRLREHLAARGVAAGVHYPQAVPLTPAYQHLGCSAGDFPVAEGLAARGLSLPLYPELGLEELDYAAAQVRGFFA
jgi:dTDP-4-amino-4,6-dideoxygalactose transaminase